MIKRYGYKVHIAFSPVHTGSNKTNEKAKRLSQPVKGLWKQPFQTRR
jgi:hypothetical protein